jgi:hypothetical protein
MSILELRKRTLTALLLAFIASTMLPACSSTDEAAQEDPSSEGGTCPEGSEREWPECLPL